MKYASRYFISIFLIVYKFIFSFKAIEEQIEEKIKKCSFLLLDYYWIVYLGEYISLFKRKQYNKGTRIVSKSYKS